MIRFDRFRPPHLQATARPSHAPTTHFIFMLACVAPLYTGCSASEEDVAAEQAVMSPVSLDEHESDEASAESQESSRFVSRESLPEHWLPPIADSDQFFMPPPTNATPVAPQEAKLVDAQVRLLGFAKIGTGAQAVHKAILKFSDKLVYMKVGDSHSGVELVSIKEKSVNLQQGRERWTLALMDQPITNAPVPYPTLQRQNSNHGGSPYSSTPAPAEPSPFPDGLPQDDLPAGGFGSGDASQPNFPGMQAPGLELPDFDLPEIDIPGLDLPEIPGQ